MSFILTKGLRGGTKETLEADITAYAVPLDGSRPLTAPLPVPAAIDPDHAVNKAQLDDATAIAGLVAQYDAEMTS